MDVIPLTSPTLLLAAALLAATVLAPAAAAAPNLLVRATPQLDEVAVAPGQRGNVSLTVAVEFRETQCQAGTRAGIDLVFLEGFPEWAGASLEPASAAYAAPRETKASRLELYLGEDAPPGESVTYKIRTAAHLPEDQRCTPPLGSVDARDASVKLTVLAPQGTTSGANGKGPGLDALPLLVLLGLLAWVRRAAR